ncbi:MAG: hypothetical protein WCL28_07075 [bacterium]
MRFVLGVIATLLSVTSCSGKKVESRQAEQPTEVSGGFGLTMQCSVLNRDTDDATSSNIGCLVYNDDGSRFTGSIVGTTAEIVTSSGEVINAAQIVSGASAGNYSVGVEVANLKPSDAATIRISASFDNSPRMLVASLKGRLATTCDEDVTYYVDKTADVKNILCTKDRPCPSINSAINLFPDIISCKITIEIVGLEFIESILINTKQLQHAGQIIFEGVKSKDGKLPIINQPSGNKAHFTLVGLESSTFTSTFAVIIRNLALKGQGQAKGISAVVSRSSKVALENMEISQYETAVRLSDSSSIGLRNVTITDSGRGLLAPNDTRVINLAGEIVVMGSATINSKHPKRSDFPGIHILGAGLITIGVEPFSLKIKDFDQGLSLTNATASLQPGHKIEIQNIRDGIVLQDAKLKLIDQIMVRADLTEAQQVMLDQNTPLSIAIKDFQGAAFNLNKGTISDDTIALDVKPKIEITSALTSLPTTQLISAVESSSVILVNSALDFCLAAPAQIPPAPLTPWDNNPNSRARYAMTVHSESDALLHWDQSPFRKSNECSPNVRHFVQTYEYRFPAPSNGTEACPIGYQKASDNICYGSMGYARHRHKIGEDFFLKFLGVLESDSRIDNLPTP